MRVGELKVEYEKERSVPLQPSVMLQSMQIAVRGRELFLIMHWGRTDTCCCGRLLGKRIVLEGVTCAECEPRRKAGGKTTREKGFIYSTSQSSNTSHMMFHNQVKKNISALHKPFSPETDCMCVCVCQ